MKGDKDGMEKDNAEAKRLSAEEDARTHHNR